jgi:hypothetical protein
MKVSHCMLAVLLLGLPLAANAAGPDPRSAFERRCERQLKPELGVTLSDFEYKVHNTVSSKVLNNRNLRSDLDVDRVLGLTTVETRTRVSSTVKLLSDPASGRECVAPMLDVEVDFPKVDVFVAREFSPATCSFRFVLAHEMRHVQLYRDLRPRLQSMIREEMDKRFGTGLLYGAAGQGQSTVDEFVETRLRPMIHAELSLVQETQKQIDSLEEAFRLSNACQGEVYALMARF